MKPNQTYEAWLHHGTDKTRVLDKLVVEVPLEICINDAPMSVTMQTPGHEHDLVRGLFYSEDIFRSKTAAPQMHLSTDDERNLLRINAVIPQDLIGKGYMNSRQLLSVSSCGICGRTAFEPRKGVQLQTQRLALPDIEHQFQLMKKSQDLFALTGGCHSAAAFDKNGNLLVIREDIGRHNAVDKVVGALLNLQQLEQAHSLLVSGRVSYEIVAKCFMAGVPILAAVSAPSSLAVDFAKELGIRLLGFCRVNRLTVYS